MWISKAVQQMLDIKDQINTELRVALSVSTARAEKLVAENTRLRADQDWFKLRLNMVEKERAQLIFAAVGTKINVPEFVPMTHNPEDAVNAMPDFSSIGNDAVEDNTAIEQDHAVNYSLMPGYQRQE